MLRLLVVPAVAVVVVLAPQAQQTKVMQEVLGQLEATLVVVAAVVPTLSVVTRPRLLVGQGGMVSHQVLLVRQ